MEAQDVTSMEEWKRLWTSLAAATGSWLLVFKRSPICPTSHFAEQQFKDFLAGRKASANLKVISVDVIGARPVSKQIAADTGVQHQSPQALLLGGGQKVLWQASHGDIEAPALEKALACTEASVKP